MGYQVSLTCGRAPDGSSRLRADHIQAQYPVDTVDMTDHPDKKRLGNMIQELSQTAIQAQSPGDENWSQT